jgi:hypothetical protein
VPAAPKATWDVALTLRCIDDDLGLPVPVIFPPIDEYSSKSTFVAAFAERRSLSPEGQELLKSAKRANYYTFHHGTGRGATWYDRSNAVVWLLGFNPTSHEGSYDYVEHLHELGRLAPTRLDEDVLRRTRFVPFFEKIAGAMRTFVAQAVDHPGEVQETLLLGRVAIRAIAQPESYALGLSVAVSRRLRPGNDPMPEDWIALVLGIAFDQDFDNVEWDPEDLELRPDEIGCFGYVEPGALAA